MKVQKRIILKTISIPIIAKEILHTKQSTTKTQMNKDSSKNAETRLKHAQ